MGTKARSFGIWATALAGSGIQKQGQRREPQTLTMIHRAVELLSGTDWVGMVLGNEGRNFSAGASLNYIGEQAERGN